MNRLLQNNKLQIRLEYLFKAAFLLYAMLSFNSVTYGSPIISIIMWSTLVLGATLVIWRAARFRDYSKAPGFWAMILFLFSFAISTLLHSSYDFKKNIIHLAYLVLYFLVLYLHDQNRHLDSIKRELRVFGWIFTSYMTICTIASIVLMLIGYGSVYEVGADRYEVICGFLWGRLWGVFLEPNRASSMAVVSIALLVYFFSRYRRRLVRSLLIIMILPQLLYIGFSDSRTGRVCLLVSTLFGVFLWLWLKWQKQWQSVVKAVVIAILASAVAFYTPVLIKDGYNQLVELRNATAPDEDHTMDAIDRNYDTGEDISNRRFAIWASGVEMFRQNMVFGTSFCGIRPYAHEYMPDTYIVNNDQTDFNHFHNEILTVAVSQGICGLIPFFFMVISVIVFLVRHLLLPLERERKLISMLFAGVLSAASSAMLLVGMFYGFSPGEIMFWMLLGYLVAIMKKTKQEKEVDKTV